jgi:hypothetical protein
VPRALPTRPAPPAAAAPQDPRYCSLAALGVAAVGSTADGSFSASQAARLKALAAGLPADRLGHALGAAPLEPRPLPSLEPCSAAPAALGGEALQASGAALDAAQPSEHSAGWAAGLGAGAGPAPMEDEYAFFGKDALIG